MRDVLITALIYTVLFVLLTTPVTTPVGSLSVETMRGLHHLVAEIIFWIAAFYICASATYGAFARQDRFGLSQNYPVLNRILSLLLILSPILVLFWNVRFVYLMLGLLLFSHLRSKTDDEKHIEFSKSRAFSNMVLIPLFTLALMLMNVNDYFVASILELNAINDFEGTTDAG